MAQPFRYGNRFDGEVVKVLFIFGIGGREFFIGNCLFWA